MNLLEQLLGYPPPEPIKAPRPRRKQVFFAGSKAKWRAVMIGKKLSTTAIAEAMGYTLEGTIASLKRMAKRGEVCRCGKEQKETPGRPGTLWKWVE